MNLRLNINRCHNTPETAPVLLGIRPFYYRHIDTFPKNQIMNGSILYKSKYGSTAQYARWLSDDLGIPILEIDKSSAESIAFDDFLVIGSPIYFGEIKVAKWLRRHQQRLKSKRIFLFVVCGTPPTNPQKVEEILIKNLPQSLQNSCNVYFLPGRINRSELSWLDRFLLNMGARVEHVPAVRAHMMEDFDSVLKSNLDELRESIKQLQERN